VAALIVFAALAVISVSLLAWQVLAAARFPLHRREDNAAFAPPVVLLKPLKGCDEHTRDCLRSWLTQQYAGPMKFLFGVADEHDPVCAMVRDLQKEFPHADTELVFTPDDVGPNGKIANLAQLDRHLSVRHSSFLNSPPLLCLSDADVHVPPDLLAQAVAPLRDTGVGMVTSFYRLTRPANFAMRIEAVAVNADFWSQVLQSNSLKPQDFALGAVMIGRRDRIESIGGLAALADYLADDYQLGNRIARSGSRVVLTRVVVECRDAAMTLRDVWRHQLRWARTIRVSQPLPYFFSILNNVSLWTTGFALAAAARGVIHVAPGFPWHINHIWISECALVWLLCASARIAAAWWLEARLAGPDAGPLRRDPLAVVAKDFMQAAVWAAAFLGNTVTWRGKTFRVRKGGRLEEVKAASKAPIENPGPTSAGLMG
jgi:ceramide glucosyltransferase